MINKIEKFVINLKRRPDRLLSAMNEFKYLGFDVNVFDGIDTNSFYGCVKSHQEIIKIAIKNNLENVIVFEDDIFFMPYSRKLLHDIGLIIEKIDFGAINLNPAFHRPVNISKVSELLIDLTEKPPKLEIHRGIYGAGFMIYNKKIYEDILNFDGHYAIDEFLNDVIYDKYLSYAPFLPVSCSTNGYSNVSEGYYNTFYIQTYNWNQYCPNKIPPAYFSENYVKSLKNQHMDYNLIK